MEIGWNFPSNNDGDIVGINDSGIVTFKAEAFKSLAREICQNSLDACDNNNIPVEIEFYVNNIERNKIPDIEQLLNVFSLCKNYWKDHKETYKFFDNGLKICKSKYIKVLRISDFNTTGLTGSDKEKCSPWKDLVKSSGVSNKNSEAGGSFGIGKAAPFVCSNLRTVFYNTLDKDGIKVHQGVSRLVSFKDTNNYITQGKGYYGKKINNSGINDLISFDEYKRKSIGTDIYIIGFIDNDDWIDEIIKSILSEFLISIYNNKLKVKIQNEEINNNTLNELVEKYKDNKEFYTTYSYYKVLTSDKTNILEMNLTNNNLNLGKFELRILIENELPRSVLMTRSNGMKIFDQKNISQSISFSGICILKDKNINSYFRKMENANHTKWDEGLADNPKEAKKIKKQLFKEIKDKIFEEARNCISDEIDAIGIGDIIPDLKFIDGDELKIESINDEIDEISELEKVKVVSNIGIEKENNLIFSNNTSYKNTLNSKKEKSISNSPLAKLFKPIRPVNVRSFIHNKTLNTCTYKLCIYLDKPLNFIIIKLKMSGEQRDTNEFLKILSAESIEKNDNILLPKQDNSKQDNCSIITIQSKEPKKKFSLFYSINYSEMCSMELEYYDGNKRLS